MRSTTPKVLLTSYLLSALAVVTVLYYHLLSAVLSGLAVYVLTAKLARRLPARWGTKTRGIALAGIILMVALLVQAVALGLSSFFAGHQGFATIMGAVAERLDNLRRNLPPNLADAVPDSVEELREQLAKVLHQHGRNISNVGMSGAKTLIHVLFGMAIGGMAVMHRYTEEEAPPPLAGALHDRLRALAGSFDKIVFAQVQISSLNTLLTALYLAVILPLCGIHMPMTTLLILLTFVVGLLPVVGNLISNTVIVLIGLGVSSSVGMASLAFLIFIHKLEYFTNAKIVGGRVNASAWELLTAMLIMEAIFGVAGMVAAPIIYAWLKAELTSAGLV
jgi:predicted PurR-regulated permease PerM